MLVKEKAIAVFPLCNLTQPAGFAEIKSEMKAIGQFLLR